jgi:hypothetical protein
VQLAPAGGSGPLPEIELLQAALGSDARVGRNDDENGAYQLALADGVALGRALRVLLASGVEVVSCRNELPEVEEAFLALVAGEAS